MPAGFDGRPEGLDADALGDASDGDALGPSPGVGPLLADAAGCVTEAGLSPAADAAWLTEQPATRTVVAPANAAARDRSDALIGRPCSVDHAECTAEPDRPYRRGESVA